MFTQVTEELFEFLGRSDHLGRAVQNSLFFFSACTISRTPGVVCLISSGTNTSPIAMPISSKSSFAIKWSGVCPTSLGINVLRGLRQTFGKIAGSTGTGGFLLDHDHVIAEMFATLRSLVLRIANNDNSKNVIVLIIE